MLAVCAAFDEVVLDGVGTSGIDKRPVTDRIRVGECGLSGDHIGDTTHHGGVDQAVYAYGASEADRWAAELRRELPSGWFGENLRVDGLPVTDAIVGERWVVGNDGLVLETTVPRTPCRTFVAWSGEPNWVERFLARADTGSYLRVVSPGTVGAGDSITVVHRPSHGVRIRHLIPGTEADPAALDTLLAAANLPTKVRRDATRKRARLRTTA